MTFNSFQFLVFLPMAFLAYWALGRSVRLQNLFVVCASYVFYGWWDWRFLSLIAFTSAWSYAFGLLERRAAPRSRGSKVRLALSCAVNLGILGCFKYAGFFVGEAQSLLSALGIHVHLPALRLMLPVGISFYTFQALSYTIDVYRRAVAPTRDPVAFFAFISFFPQLVAGPIERARDLLPQFQSPRRFSYPEAVVGCRQMLWGFFKKAVVADNCAVCADAFLHSSPQGNGAAVWIGMLFFAFQIYGDFSGYSDIAIGVARLFGIRLTRNFAFPYFAQGMSDFWRRWHISLMAWFRDYLYIPLGGNRQGRLRHVVNIFVVFLVSGLWHGANWTFVLWGGYHACLLMPSVLSAKAGADRRGVDPKGLLGMLRTFFLVVVGWTFFRARSVGECFDWVCAMFDLRSFSAVGHVPGMGYATVAVITMLACEWFNREGVFGFWRFPERRSVRWAIYLFVAFASFLLLPRPQPFIYFQF